MEDKKNISKKPGRDPLHNLKDILSASVKVFPKNLRYTIRSHMRLHDSQVHPELNLIDFNSGSKVIIDVGAHEGGFTGELLLRAPLAKFHCFEPNPNVFPILEKNCIGYGLLDHKPRALAHNVALGSKEGVHDFLITKNSACSSFFTSSDHNKAWAGDYCEVAETRPVKVSTLASYAADHNIHDVKLLKIDTQGSELEVLIGAAELLASIEYVYAEVQFVALYEGAPLWTDLIRYMWGQQFFPFLVGGFCLSPDGENLQADILFKNCRYS